MAEGTEFRKKAESQAIKERLSSKMKKTDLQSSMREVCSRKMKLLEDSTSVEEMIR